MNIGFIEDTPLHGGTQIWVTEAMDAFLEQGHDITLLAPEGSWIVKQRADSGASIFTYDWDDVVQEVTSRYTSVDSGAAPVRRGPLHGPSSQKRLPLLGFCRPMHQDGRPPNPSDPQDRHDRA